VNVFIGSREKIIDQRLTICIDAPARDEALTALVALREMRIHSQQIGRRDLAPMVAFDQFF
jgi:hypothetical protein